MHEWVLKVPRAKAKTTIWFCQSPLFATHLPELIATHQGPCAIITDATLKKLYAKQLQGLDAKVFSIPSGETAKTRETKAYLEDLLLSHHLGRDTLLIGLGGGVICDIVGFVAATYCRGVSLVLIPTTLLAMVDAAIGGKTGVNTPYGKNTIGSFYFPDQVLIDPSFLQTLPKQELRNGLVEVIKYSLIASKPLFVQLQKHINGFASLDVAWIKHLIQKSIRIKGKDIREDPFEQKGRRRILNYGHTIGHALEKLEEYRMPHGQAVAIGMMAAAFMSCEMGFLRFEQLEEIQALFQQYDIPLKLKKTHPIDAFLTGFALDKKAVKGSVRFVLLKEIGAAHPFEGEYCTEVPFPILEKALAWMNR
jgi:3-dehydroquinate synthase